MNCSPTQTGQIAQDNDQIHHRYEKLRVREPLPEIKTPHLPDIEGSPGYSFETEVTFGSTLAFTATAHERKYDDTGDDTTVGSFQEDCVQQLH